MKKECADMKKILVIGLDAACLNNIMPWINEGHLPSLKHLLDIGIYSDGRIAQSPSDDKIQRLDHVV